MQVRRLLLTNISTLRPRQNGRHFANDTFKRIFVNENVRILIEISLTFVPKGPINNIPSLVYIMAWRRPGDKPLSEPMMVCLPTHICVTRPQWVNEQALKLWHGLMIASTWNYKFNIVVASNERQGVSNHRQLHCLFNSGFFILPLNKTKFCITGPLYWGCIGVPLTNKQ